MAKEQLLPKILADARRKVNVVRRLAKNFHPKLIAAVGQQQPANGAAHAMADDDDGFHAWEPLFHSVEFLPQDGRGIGIGIATWIAVEPELVVLADDRIAAQLVNHRSPRRL